MLDPANGLTPGDPARMAARIIDTVDVEPAPLRVVLGSQALESTLTTLRGRIADFEVQRELAASTDFPPGEQGWADLCRSFCAPTLSSSVLTACESTPVAA